MHNRKTLSLGPLLTNRFGDRYFHEINGLAFNQVGSDALYRRQFGDILERADTLYIVAGTDSGQLVKHVSRRGIGEGSRFLFIEQPEVIERLNGYGVLQGMDERITICPAEGWMETALELGLRSYLYIDSVVPIRSMAALDGKASPYHVLWSDLCRELGARRFETMLSLGMRQFVDLQLANLADNIIPFSTLGEKIYAGRTCVVLAGGPSLDETIQWVKENRQHLVLIAVSRIAARLTREEIRPDIICSVDPYLTNYLVSKEMFDLGEDALFVHANHVHSALIGQWPGKSLYLGSRFPWETANNPQNPCATPPTVTNCALSVAIELGFSRIILAGADFCYSREGYTHASGTIDHSAGPMLAMTDTTVETNGGWQAGSKYEFSLAAEMLGRQAEFALKQGTRVINTAAGAARVEHVEYLPLNRIELGEKPDSTVQRVCDTVESLQPEQYIEHQKNTLAELMRMRRDLEQIRKLAAEALECNAVVCDERGRDTERGRSKVRLDKIEKKLDGKLKNSSRFVKIYGIRNFLRMGVHNRDIKWNEQKVERAGQIYYQAYRDSAAQLIGLLEESSRRIRSRIEEQAGRPDFKALFQQWRSDSQQGRALVWKLHNGERYDPLPAGIKQEFALLEREFEDGREQSAAQVSGHIGSTYAEYLERQRNLAAVLPRMEYLFACGDVEGLEMIIGGLASYETDEARWLARVANGLLAELSGCPDRAMICYQEAVVARQEPVVLQRICDISIQSENHENATLALELLASMSPAYMPMYADILRLRGQKTEALQIYHDYLDQVPDDLATVIKVGRFYLDLNAMEAAQDAFDYVLQRDPDNRAAQELRRSATRQAAAGCCPVA